MTDTPFRRVVVAGGGTVGVCCFAGAVQRYHEKVGPIHHIAGVSAGSIIAAAYASGKRNLVDLIVEMFTPEPLASLSPGVRPFVHAYDSDRIRDLLKGNLAPKMGDTLSRLSVVTWNSSTRLQMVWDSDVHTGIPTWEACYSSMCIPFAFAPIKMGKAYHFDGGITSNFPVDDIFGSNSEGVVGFYKHASNRNHGIPSSSLALMLAILDGMLRANVTEDITGTKADLLPIYAGGPTLKLEWTEHEVRLLAAAGAQAVDDWLAASGA